MKLVADRYEPVRLLGRGGMGEVWLARTHGPSGFTKVVALKVSSGSSLPENEHASLLRHEARIAAALAHPNLVDVYELGTHQGRDFIAMEYVSGVDLRRVLAQARTEGRGLPPEAIAFVVSELLAGLEHAHRARDEHGRPMGLVHRDVTPSNVLLSFAGEVKLIDFGIAKVAGGQETRTGVLKGKFRYMSPEQARGDPLDARSDLYSVGTLLFEALTGAPAYPGDDDVSILSRVQRGEHQPLGSVPEAFRSLVGRCLESRPERRIGSAAELRELLIPVSGEGPARWESQMVAEYLQRRFHPIVLPPPVPGADANADLGPARSARETTDQAPVLGRGWR